MSTSVRRFPSCCFSFLWFLVHSFWPVLSKFLCTYPRQIFSKLDKSQFFSTDLASYFPYEIMFQYESKSLQCWKHCYLIISLNGCCCGIRWTFDKKFILARCRQNLPVILYILYFILFYTSSSLDRYMRFGLRLVEFWAFCDFFLFFHFLCQAIIFFHFFPLKIFFMVYAHFPPKIFFFHIIRSWSKVPLIFFLKN